MEPERTANERKKEMKTIKLEETGTKGIYTAQIGGKLGVVIFQSRNRSKAQFKLNAVTVAASRLRKVGSVAAANGNAPVFVAVEISVAGRFNHSVCVTAETFKKIQTAHTDFPLGEKARAVFAADKKTIEGARFEILAPPKATTAAEPKVAKLQAA
jgi:hypothetical protein